MILGLWRERGAPLKAFILLARSGPEAGKRIVIAFHRVQGFRFRVCNNQELGAYMKLHGMYTKGHD